MGKQILSLFILSHILDYQYHKMSLQTRKPKSLCHILRYPFSTVAKLKKIELKNKVPSTNSSKMFSFTESRNKDYLSFFLPRFLHFSQKQQLLWGYIFANFVSYGLPRVNIAKGQFITRSIRGKSGSKQIIKGNSCKIIKKKSIRENKSLQKEKQEWYFLKDISLALRSLMLWWKKVLSCKLLVQRVSLKL